MILGVIADDFTGASDIAAMLGRGGMSTELLIGVPTDETDSSADAIVVALKSRSIAPREAIRQSLAALEWLKAAGARQFVFKYCSTFDSTPSGNIGPVAEALAAALGVRGVVACPALPENGRVVFAGHLFVKGRLLSESGLEKHPLNPMTDSDIRRWLGRQTVGDVGLVDYKVVRQGPDAIAAALAVAPETLVIVDADSDTDLIAIGRAVRDAKLITGGSGVAMALPDNFRDADCLTDSQSAWRGVKAPGVVLSGSCSYTTRRQVEAYASQHPHLMVPVAEMMRGEAVLPALVAFATEHSEAGPLLYSSAESGAVASLQREFGREAVAARLERLFGELAVALRDVGFGRIAVAGGETSGAIVAALGVERFVLGPEISPGVPSLLAAGKNSLAMALKSGNFGGEHFFTEALEQLAGHEH